MPPERQLVVVVRLGHREPPFLPGRRGRFGDAGRAGPPARGRATGRAAARSSRAASAGRQAAASARAARASNRRRSPGHRGRGGSGRRAGSSVAIRSGAPPAARVRRSQGHHVAGLLAPCRAGRVVLHSALTSRVPRTTRTGIQQQARPAPCVPPGADTGSRTQRPRPPGCRRMPKLPSLPIRVLARRASFSARSSAFRDPRPPRRPGSALRRPAKAIL